MPNYRRLFVPGACYFFTVVTNDRAPILITDHARTCLRQAFVETRGRWPFRIAAMVLLPDHLHTIWALPHGDDAFPRRWASIKRAFSRSWLESGGTEQSVSRSKRLDRRRGVWQRRYHEHVLRDEADFENHCHYIHYNPVKHGLVERPNDWPYSSFSRFVKAGDYPADWACGTPPPPMLDINE